MTPSAEKNLFDLTGKVVLVTGAAGLLGEQHARAILDAGGSVVLTDYDERALAQVSAKLVRQYGEERTTAMRMDVTDHQSVSAVNASLEQLRLSPKILINNAAIDAKVSKEMDGIEMSRLETFSLAQWQREIDVGLMGAFICSQVFGSEMARSGTGGAILNIASDLSVIAPDQRLYQVDDKPHDQQPVKPVTYSVIKSGLLGLTRYLATYWTDQGIRCNALSPGGVYNGQNEEFLERVNSRIPMGRMAGLKEYHGAIQFLCSDASSYMNGQNLVIDGGRSIW